MKPKPINDTSESFSELKPAKRSEKEFQGSIKRTNKTMEQVMRDSKRMQIESAISASKVYLD